MEIITVTEELVMPSWEEVKELIRNTSDPIMFYSTS
jgi:hypothetical protein